MKKKILVMACLISVYTLQVNAQRSNSSDYDPKARPNIVKLNISSLVYKNISLQYERVLGEKISVACGIRFMPKGSLPFSDGINTLASSDSTKASDWKAGSFALTPEFRFYPKHAGKGFYLAPYLRYRNVSLDLPVDYTDDNGVRQHIDAKGSFSSIIGGLMIGSQFNFGKMITLDWYIIGFQYGSNHGSLTINTSQALSANDQNDIRNTLEDIRTSANVFKKMNYTVASNGGSISGTFNSFGIRGFGLNLGFKF